MQAREFFGSAEASTLNTRPVLLYYGALNLAEAAHGLLRNGRPKPAHGMNIKAGQGLAEWSIVFRNKGVVQDFANLFGVSITQTDNGNQSGRVDVSLGDFLSRDPSASRLLDSHHILPALCGDVYAIEESRSADKIYEAGLHLWLFRARTTHDVDAITRFADPVTSELDRNARIVCVEKSGLGVVGYERTVNHRGALTPAIPGQASWWPYPIRQFAAIWILSEISRYSPQSLSFSAPVETRRFLPAIEVLMQDILRTFPNEVLNLINEASMDFGRPFVLL